MQCKVAPTPFDRPLDRFRSLVYPPPGTSPAHTDAMADDHHQSTYQPSPSITWGRSPHIYPHSHHGTPAQEYSNFHFGSPQLSLGSSTFESTMPQRPVQQQLQPLVMPQWPSMLNSQSHQTFQPSYPQNVQPIQPMTMAWRPTMAAARRLVDEDIAVCTSRTPGGQWATGQDGNRARRALARGGVHLHGTPRDMAPPHGIISSSHHPSLLASGQYRSLARAMAMLPTLAPPVTACLGQSLPAARVHMSITPQREQ